MAHDFARLLKAILRVGTLLLVFNEIRGLIMAAPVLYGIYQAGGTLGAIWLGFCALGGIALSILIPAFALRKLDRMQTAPA